MADMLDTYIIPAAWMIAKIVAIVVPIMLSVAYLTLAERKVIGAMQLRKGPNVVGPFGLLQPIADGVKLFLKETVIPTGANRGVFIAAPMITFILALVAWAVIPFDAGMVLADINASMLQVGRDKLLERTPKQLHSMLNQMFMELTLLGFIGIILFFVEQSGPLDELSMNLFDDEEVSARFAPSWSSCISAMPPTMVAC